MDLLFDREANVNERLAFVRSSAAWVKRTPNAEWSRQQAELIDSFFIRMHRTCQSLLRSIVSGLPAGRDGCRETRAGRME